MQLSMALYCWTVISRIDVEKILRTAGSPAESTPRNIIIEVLTVDDFSAFEIFY